MKKKEIRILVLLFIMFCTFMVNNNKLEANIMESRNLVTAREMLQKGNWFTPTMNGEERLEKPPLPTWIAAGAMAVFGPDHMGWLRFPAVLAGMLLIFFIYKFTQEITESDDLPFLTAGTAASSFYVLFMARDISWDIFCHSFMFGAIWLIHKASKNRGDSWKDYVIAGFLMGLSALSKGPVSFYSLLLPYLLARGFVYGWKSFRGRKMQIGVMILITLILGFSWPIYTYMINPEISVSVAQKESSAWISHNIRPFFHYWSFPVQSGIWTFTAAIALVFPYSQKRIGKFLNYRLIAGWIWFSVLLLSLFPEKKERYLLPVLLPLAILTAGYFKYLLEAFNNNSNTKTDTVLLRINAFVFALICIIIPNGLFSLAHDKTEPSRLVLFTLTAVFLVFALIFVRSGIRKKPMTVWSAMVGLMMATGLLLMPVLPKIIQTNPFYHSYQKLRNRPELNQLPFFYSGEVSGKFIEVVWSSGHEIQHWNPKENSELPTTPPFVLLSHEKPDRILPPGLGSNLQVEVLGHYDKNLQQEKRQEVLANYVSLIRNK